MSSRHAIFPIFHRSRTLRKSPTSYQRPAISLSLLARSKSLIAAETERAKRDPSLCLRESECFCARSGASSDRYLPFYRDLDQRENPSFLEISENLFVIYHRVDQRFQIVLSRISIPSNRFRIQYTERRIDITHVV